MPSQTAATDLETLLKLRLVVARYGEMDLARWWNTKGQLGALGAVALKRGFPRTHYFAQARSVFAVAARRCNEIFEVPGTVTLWRLPEATEEEFDSRWEHWLDHTEEWSAFFERVQRIESGDLVSVLKSFELVGPGDLDRYARVRRSAEGRAVPLPGIFSGGADDITLLALGFARAEPGALAVPYAKWDAP